ncbi:WD40/YVTN/BNR-like repeat-containing protein [Parathalassolituus penaei]|uniref:YCF48-related protein n=1 Tax=Parathalassolituus penaei TaxID=2997323 RepID=A0A9X3EF50_9GAMM|nr:YCF48-related protein [Parathalassolituus penaei]MCY0966402.1 YCF48-related protein [Parathalassolituus penaei]
MYSFRNHSDDRRCGRWGGSITSGALALLVAALWPVQSVQAGWTDPLDTPAETASLANQALVLDVARRGDNLVAVGAYGNILLSDKAGLQWQQASVPVRVTLTSVAFVDENHGWACGHDGVILATADGGASWLRQFDGFLANKAVVAAAEQQLADAEASLAELEDNGDDTTDAEALVESANFALDDARYDLQSGSTRPCLDIQFQDLNTGMAVGAYGSLFITHNGGQTWEEASSRINNPDRFHLNFVRAISANEWWLGGESGLLFRSSDAGEHWEAVESPYEGSLFDLNRAGDYRILAGLRGHLFRLDDSGEWQEIDHEGDQTFNASTSLDDGSLLLVGNGGALLHLGTDGSVQDEKTLAGSKSMAAVAVVNNGYLVAGEGGLVLVNPQGETTDARMMPVQESAHAAQ